MFNIELISIVLGVTIGIGGTVTVLFPLLKKKGINTEKIIKDSNEILKAADGVVNVVDTLIPNNPVVNVLKLVDKYAHIGVNQAEQLYLTSQLDKDKRNEKAKEAIYAILEELGIEKNNNIEKIIDGAIEAEVLALGHKDKTEEEKIKEKEELNKKLQEQIQENIQLKNKITTIQNTVASTV